jgi:DNA mismatch endonuclease, patch repair protein
MDTLTREERSIRMGLVRGKNTRPELAVRKAVYALGYRYRLHRRNVPGRPDLVFRSRRKVIFVHGCFWHRHPGCARTRTPKSRIPFWEKKFRENVERDEATAHALSQQGWRALTIWECQTESPEELSRLLRDFLENDR